MELQPSCAPMLYPMKRKLALKCGMLRAATMSRMPSAMLQSHDGIHWVKFAGNPVLEKNPDCLWSSIR